MTEYHDITFLTEMTQSYTEDAIRKIAEDEGANPSLRAACRAWVIEHGPEKTWKNVPVGTAYTSPTEDTAIWVKVSDESVFFRNPRSVTKMLPISSDGAKLAEIKYLVPVYEP